MNLIEKTCRLCVRKSVILRSLLSDNGLKMIESLTSIKIEDNKNLPTVACTKCWLNLKIAYRIQQNFLEAEAQFKVDSIQICNNSISILDNNEICIIKEDPVEFENEIDISESERHVLDTTDLTCRNNDKDILKVDNYVLLNDNNKSTILEESSTKCVICAGTFKKSEISQHIQDHFGQQHCDCGVKLDSIQLYHRHYQKEHSKVPFETWICKHCKFKFQYKTLFNIHMKNAHQTKKTKCNKKIKSNRKAICNTDVSTERFFCSKCKRSFDDEDMYYTHLKTHAKRPCHICGRKITPDNISKHIRLHGAAPQICHLCGAVAKNFESFRSHMYRTHSTKEFVCEHCGQKFKKSFTKVMHIRREHTGKLELNFTEPS